MRTITTLLIALLITVGALIHTACGGPDSDEEGREYAPWWDYGWQCRRPIVIDNTKNAEELRNYQIQLNLSYDSDMCADFSDIRFAQYINGKNQLLPYWIEKKSDGGGAIIWVNVSQIKSKDTTQIHVYYGSSGASPASDLAGTFLREIDGGRPLKGSWHFDDGGGAAASDTSGAGNHASLVNGPAWTTGRHGGALSFDGTNDYVRAPDVTNGMATGSVELWFKINSWNVGKNGMYFWSSAQGDLDTNAGDGMNLGAHPSYYSDGRLLFGIYDMRSGWQWAASNTIPSPGLWYHVVGIWGSGGIKFYINGKLDGTNGYTGSAPTYTNRDLIGASSWSGSQINGVIDEARIYSRALSDAEISDLFMNRGYTTVSYPGRVLVRSHASREPEVVVGEEERCVRLRSFSLVPALLDEGDSVEARVMLENVGPEELTVRVSVRDGESFEGSREICATELTLAPRAETEVNFTWVPEGGSHTVWLALMGAPLASRTIYVNRYPVLTPITDQVLTQGKSFRLLLFAEDPDGDGLNWSDDTHLFNITPRGNWSAEVNFTPSNDDVGLHRVNITVKDPRGCADSQIVNFTVKNVNDHPVIEPIRDQSVAQDSEFSYRAKASDIDEKWGDSITFSDDSVLFDIDPETGEFSFTPTNEQVGKYTITITATDKQKASASTVFNLTVTNINDPPTINPIEPQTLLEDELWQAVATATDPDLKIKVGEELRFSDDTFLFDIDPMTGLMSFTPTNDNIGVLTANITVTDLGGLSSTTTLVITVLNANDPPLLDRISDKTTTEDELFEMTVTASDPDLRWGLDNLTFSDDSPLFDVDPRMGKISFTPGNEHVGKHLITIKVTDESGASDKATFSITVLNVNDPPFNVRILSPADGERVREGVEIWLNASAEDIDAFDVLTFSWFDNGEPVGEGRSVPVKLKPGRHTISLEVSDGTEKALAEVSIVVLKVERVTVKDYGWVAGAGMALAIVIILVITAAAIMSASRKGRKREGAEGGAAVAQPGAAGGAGAEPASPPVAGAAGAAAAMAPLTGVSGGAAAGGDEMLNAAKKIIGRVEDALADHIEKHPEGTENVSAVMEKLDLARAFLAEGDGEASIQHAVEAKAALAAASRATGATESVVAAGGLRCPLCGEPLEPEWPRCPVCGHGTR